MSGAGGSPVSEAGAARSALVAVGNELLSGRTVDTNSAFLARVLAEAGAPVARGHTVPDEPEAIRRAVADSLDEVDVVVITGGLGPTEDDRTREAVAGVLGRPLRLDAGLLRRLEERFRAAGRPRLPETNRSQALVPEGATVLPNPHGTAPGLLLGADGGRWVALLPGVPREMRSMVAESLVPALRERLGGRLAPLRHRLIRTTGVAESELAERVEAVLEGPVEEEGVEIAFLPHTTGVDLRLSRAVRPGEPETDAEAALERVARRLEPAVGRWRYGRPARGADGAGEDLVQTLARLLRARGRTLAVAESCTGGLLGMRLTRYPGASDFFLGGVIAYDDRIKTELLDVPADVLRAEGAVSEPVAREMAVGVARRLGSDCAVSITGVAGPGGGSEEKPVGTVCWAAVADGEVLTRRRIFPGRRDDVRERSAQAALDLLRRMLEGVDEES